MNCRGKNNAHRTSVRPQLTNLIVAGFVRIRTCCRAPKSGDVGYVGWNPKLRTGSARVGVRIVGGKSSRQMPGAWDLLI